MSVDSDSSPCSIFSISMSLQGQHVNVSIDIDSCMGNIFSM